MTRTSVTNNGNTTSTTLSGRSRMVIFGILTATCLVVAAGYVAWAVLRSASAETTTASGPVAIQGSAVNLESVEQPSGTLMFRNVVAGEHFNVVGAAPVDDPEGTRRMMPLACLRVYYAADRGLCLVSDEGFITTYHAYVFGPDFQVQHKIPLGGIPSRTRVSPDGRHGATTVFVAGHSYADSGFSTETTLIDMAGGTKLGNLEEFTVWRDGNRFESIDFNFWGVTFAQDSNRFYATLSTRGQTYLVEGDVNAREMRVLRENVECPSLSPDNTRIAFKKRVGGGLAGAVWRFHVLDLATMTETPLAEARSIDDQIEWLDDDNVLYAVSSDLWTTAADGRGEARKFMSKALSPAVIRASNLTSPATADVQTGAVTLPSTDLAVEVSVDPNPAGIGADVTQTVTVINHGPADATDILLDNLLPDGSVFGALGETYPSSSSYGCPLQDGNLSCTVYRLASGESWTISFTYQPQTEATITNPVTVSGTEPDPQPENNSATIEIEVTPRQ